MAEPEKNPTVAVVIFGLIGVAAMIYGFPSWNEDMGSALRYRPGWILALAGMVTTVSAVVVLINKTKSKSRGG